MTPLQGFLFGAIGSLLVLLAVAVGYFVGRHAVDVPDSADTGAAMDAPVEELSEKEKKKRKQLIEEQEAFDELMHYNIENVYGVSEDEWFRSISKG